MRFTSPPLAAHFKLEKGQRAESVEERKEMELIPYPNIVGSLMYMMICTRSVIAHAISATSRYMASFGKQHWNALKWTLRYLKGADKSAILYTDEGGEDEESLVAIVTMTTQQILTQEGHRLATFSPFMVVCWKFSLQNVVALSTTEAVYMALTSAVKESKWLLGLISEFEFNQRTVTVYCDNNVALCLARHQMFHERSKHIDVRLHFIRDEVENGRVKVIKIDTTHKPADMFTKPLSKEKF